ncbi:MAG: hypothetical protein HY565_06050 [Candidatus Kerfeldbacteria bacterium]|nr:hypothetical protein [Candidatus Kerfeldbacteria bacterium]
MIVVLIAIGFFGLKLVEPTATWSDAAVWTVTAFSTFGMDMFLPTTQASKWFQALFLLGSFMMTAFGLTVVIPPFLYWWEAPRKGLASVRRSRQTPLYLLVGPVDWEKVESVYWELQRAVGHISLVVVVSETLTEIPMHLQRLGIQFVNGSLRRNETYQRAGIDWATGAFICAASYNDPTADVQTAAITEIIERYQRSVKTVTEVVSADNADLFDGRHGADQSVLFDPLTLAAVAKLLAKQLAGRSAKIIVNTIDEAQRAELGRQLAAAGIIESEEGVLSRIILPEDLDNPVGSDAKVWAALKRAREEVIVGMYCSIVSNDLFADHDNVVCADQVMAQQLVAAMR